MVCLPRSCSCFARVIIQFSSSTTPSSRSDQRLSRSRCTTVSLKLLTEMQTSDDCTMLADADSISIASSLSASPRSTTDSNVTKSSPTEEAQFLSRFHAGDAARDSARFDIALYLRRVGGSRSARGKCLACQKAVPWSRERVASHKANCKSSSVADRELFSSYMRAENERKRAKRVLTRVASPTHKKLCVNIPSDTDSMSSKGSRHVTHRIQAHWIDVLTVADKERITQALADLFYRTGIPFAVVESHAMQAFICAIRPAYMGHIPKARALSTTFLDRAYNSLMEKMRIALTDSQFYSIVTDGWSNSSNEHHVNYVIVLQDKTPFFYKAVCTSGEPQTGATVAAGIISIMKEIGAEKCVSVVSDNAANMRNAGDIIEQQYPTVFANGCAAHVLNLLVKDICEMEKFAPIVEKMVFVARFIKERQHVLAYFNAKNTELAKGRKLMLPAPTRWFTHYGCAERLITAKFAVMSLLTADARSILKATRCQTTVARFTEAIEDAGFWHQLEELSTALHYPTNLIGVMERNQTDLSDIYGDMMKMHDHYNKDNAKLTDCVDAVVVEAIREIIVKRWNFMHTAVMGFAYMLRPAHLQSKWLPDDKADTRIQFKAYVRTFYTETADQDQCLEELRLFSRMKLDQSEAHFKEYASLSGMDYWILYGCDAFPLLGKIALRVFAVPTSSAAAERAWSAFSFLWSKRRNRLSTEKVHKLVFLYTNYALLDDKDDRDYVKELAMSEEDDEYAIDE